MTFEGECVTTVVAYRYLEPNDSSAEAVDWGQPIARCYTDVGDRTQWHSLLAHATPGQSLVVQRLQDLGETMAVIRDRLLELAERQIPLQVLADPLPTGKPGSAAMWLVRLQAMQEEEQRDRLRQGHARNRLNALPPPGKAPYGYRRGRDRYLLDRTTAPVIKDFFDHFLLYGSLRGSVRYLATQYNKQISVSTGQRWLTHPVYQGDLAYQTGDVIPNTHTPILSRQEAAQIERLLRRNRQVAPRSASAPRSLAGLVVCGTCQMPMTISRVSRPRRQTVYHYLRPRQCPHRPRCRALPYGAVLDETIQQICTVLPRAFGDRPPNPPPQPDLDRQMADKQAILQQLPTLLEQGILDEETTQLRAYNLRRELAALQKQRSQLPPPDLEAIAQVASLPQFWHDLSEAERRFYFREFIRQIQLTQTPSTWHIEIQFMF